ncbi:hypothetical protein EF294_03130 [Gordonia oryzae]|uniref:Uncharacterized protein n=1 Tax=Gordonia oryzae TaxID=2487349 RepID=A0A3N4GYF0_9ACTN|nr:hypothetical protein EF294_03130 [Gordonia oryzae]
MFENSSLRGRAVKVGALTGGCVGTTLVILVALAQLSNEEFAHRGADGGVAYALGVAVGVLANEVLYGLVAAAIGALTGLVIAVARGRIGDCNGREDA